MLRFGPNGENEDDEDQEEERGGARVAGGGQQNDVGENCSSMVAKTNWRKEVEFKFVRFFYF